MISVVWLADAPTFGPMVRARAVLTHPEVVGQIISCRVDFDGLDVLTPCLSVRNQRDGAVALAGLDGDVIVADWQWWRIAAADGRPWVPIGFSHRPEGSWDLDEAPLHPWGRNPPGALRDEIRAALGLSGPVVVTMSPRSQAGIIEGICRPGLERRPDVTVVVAPLLGGGVLFQAADLVVTSAGWASSWEARWSGVPHFLVRTNDSDQWLRSSRGDLVETIEKLEPLEGWALPEIPDHVPSFVEALRTLRKYPESGYLREGSPTIRS